MDESVVEVVCTCCDTIEPYLTDLLVVGGHIEALLWYGCLWLTAFLLYKLIRVFV